VIPVMKSTILLDKLYRYEKDFCDELENKEIKLLRDIKISKEKLKEITNHISKLFKSNEYKVLEEKFPVTTSLFLVWSAVYDYKDRDFWGMIFDNLNISRKLKYQNYLGDIFLKTIRKYNLLSVDSNDGKKYLSPILMHGYISNYYVGDFFDYLNKVYTKLLKYDVSEDSIERIWSYIFEDEINNEKLDKEIKVLEKAISELKEEKTEYSVPEDMLYIDRMSIENQEKHINELIAKIVEEEKNLDDFNTSLIRLDQAIKYIDELHIHLENLKNFKSYIINNYDFSEIIDSFIEFKNIISGKIDLLNTKRINSTKNIKRMKNELTIKQDKVKSLKMNIIVLGKGSLEDGWYEIERIREINQKLDKLSKLLDNKRELCELSRDIQNTSLKQILTSSLNHLYKEDKIYFKDFIIDTFQMMDAVFKEEETDTSHPLYDIFCEWHKSYKTKTVISGQTPNANKVDKDKENESIDEKDIYRRRVVLQSFIKPKIELDIFTYRLVLNVPKQSFENEIDIDVKPKYLMADGRGNETEIPINTCFQGNTLYIEEIKIPIKNSTGQSFLFKYYNLRESYSINLDSIMIFDAKGKLISNNKLNNGLYYIVCDNSWDTDFSGILFIYPDVIEGYNLYQIHLNENKAIFKNKLNNSKVEYIGSDFSGIHLEGLNIVEGITIDGVKVSTGSFPDLIIGLRDIDTTSKLKIYLNDGLILDQMLEDMMGTEIVKKSEFLETVNLQKVLGRNNWALTSKVKILLEGKNGEEIFYEEFWNLLKTKFIFEKECLLIKMPSGSRVQYKGIVKNSREYSIMLDSEKDEEFSIYYNRIGWVRFKVEVPRFDVTFRDRDGNIVEIPENLLVSELDILKDLYVTWETRSSIPKMIYLYDKEKIFESILYLKNGKVSANLYSYYDILNSIGDKTSLCFNWAGINRKSNEKSIINIHKQWKVSSIECYQTEEDDEFIIEISFHSNFKKENGKFLRVINDDTPLFEKEIMDDQLIIYIKKSELKSSIIDIEVGYTEEIDDFFDKKTVEVIAGKKELKLISKINQLDLIMKNGIIATGFKYRGKYERFKTPFTIGNIKKTEPINFIDEELYTGQAIIGNIYNQVIFYINLEKNIMPFLLDLDGDGAQYDPIIGEVFWETRHGKNIMGPIDDITFEIREE